MTASVGVGKARGLTEAMGHILKLCANLDCRHLKTVRKNWRELDEHVNKPDQDTMHVEGRKDDPFHHQVSELMEFIERKMVTAPGTTNLQMHILYFF